MLVLCNAVSHDKLDQTVRVRVQLVLEVKPIVHLDDIQALFVGVVFQYKLFEVEEGTFMVDPLP